MATTTFSLEYILSLIIAMVAFYFTGKARKNINVWIKILVGLFAGYISLLILNKILPLLNIYGLEAGHYIVSRVDGGINHMNYIFMFPPLFAILIIFIILLYTGRLG